MVRIQCESEIYHITERGVGRQIIFEDNEDRRRFGEAMARIFVEEGVSVLAWCLMDNHIHLILHGKMPDISQAMQRINSGYARRFNSRHDRTGTLFQSRFHSVTIESDDQLAIALRYVHFNPESLEPGISPIYPWSSFPEYLQGKSALGRIANVAEGLALLGGQDAFNSCHRPVSESEAISEPTQGRTVIQQAQAILGNANFYEIKQLPKLKRDEKIRALYEGGLSIRQIERVTAISRGIVSRAVKNVTK